jgi:hypothetical protein
MSDLLKSTLLESRTPGDSISYVSEPNTELQPEFEMPPQIPRIPGWELASELLGDRASSSDCPPYSCTRL